MNVRLHAFLVFSGMVVQMTIVHYFGMFSIRRTKKSGIPESMKEEAVSVMNLVFYKGIFILYIVLHIVLILIWSGNEY